MFAVWFESCKTHSFCKNISESFGSLKSFCLVGGRMDGWLDFFEISHSVTSQSVLQWVQVPIEPLIYFLFQLKRRKYDVFSDNISQLLFASISLSWKSQVWFISFKWFYFTRDWLSDNLIQWLRSMCPCEIVFHVSVWWQSLSQSLNDCWNNDEWGMFFRCMLCNSSFDCVLLIWTGCKHYKHTITRHIITHMTHMAVTSESLRIIVCHFNTL